MELRSSETKLFCKTSFKNGSFEAQKRSFSARLPSKMGASKLKNEAFLRDFLQKWELRSSKTKLFCETSFKNEASKLKNEAFLRDFLQKWSFEAQKREASARHPSKILAACTYNPLPKVGGVYMRCLFRVYMRPPDRNPRR